MSTYVVSPNQQVPTVSPGRHRADIWALTALVVLSVLAEWDVLLGATITGQDAATQFIPWYGYLGERLRAGDVPGWSPHQLGGAPFAADPQSGWTYLPAMLLFTLLPLGVAVKLFVLSSVVLAVTFTYALARALGLRIPGAFFAAGAYGLSLFVQDRTACCYAYVGVVTWLPLALLGVEMAVRATSILSRGIWWGITGLALSQVLALWIGQGSYYVLLALGGYAAYRMVFSPPGHIRGARDRLRALALHGGAVLLAGTLFGAAGLLPRLEYNRLSNLAAGYTGSTGAAVVGGWSLGNRASIITRTDWHYAGIGVLLLAVLAPFAARRRHAVPYLVSLCLAALVLAGQGLGPLRWLLYVLPGFERLHPHYPERVMSVFYLGAALLAGITVSRLWEVGISRRLGAGALGAALMVAAYNAVAPQAAISAITVAVLVLTGALLAGSALLGWRPLALTMVLGTLTAGDLLVARDGLHAHWPDQYQSVDLEEHYRRAGTPVALQRLAGHERYFGYDPQIRKEQVPYRYQWADPRTAALLVNNRATVLGLQDLQGYNPVHIARYDEFMRAVNGRSQEYRGAYVLESGLRSRLLPLLNARYAVIPPVTPSGRTDLRTLEQRYATMYADGRARVLRNPAALPRAWVVREARQVVRGEALRLIARGAVDPRHTVLTEAPPPKLDVSARRPAGAAESATIEAYEPERIVVRVSTAMPGMLVLSEIYYPAWRASVDGEPAQVYVANHALRAVPVPVGEHTVELRYESWTLRAGTWISALTCLGLVGLLVVAGARWRNGSTGAGE